MEHGGSCGPTTPSCPGLGAEPGAGAAPVFPLQPPLWAGSHLDLETLTFPERRGGGEGVGGASAKSLLAGRPAHAITQGGTAEVQAGRSHGPPRQSCRTEEGCMARASPLPHTSQI